MSQPRSQGRSGSRDGDKNKPWGDAQAPIESTNSEGESRTEWVALGAVWETEKGALQFALQAMPVAWGDTRIRRTIVITQRKDR